MLSDQLINPVIEFAQQLLSVAGGLIVKIGRSVRNCIGNKVVEQLMNSGGLRSEREPKGDFPPSFAQCSRYCPHAGQRAYHIGTCWPHLHLMLCRITLEPNRLPLVPLLEGDGPSLGSSNTCEPLDEDCLAV